MLTENAVVHRGPEVQIGENKFVARRGELIVELAKYLLGPAATNQASDAGGDPLANPAAPLFYVLALGVVIWTVKVEVAPPDNQPEDNGVMEEQTQEDSESSAQLLRTKSDAGVLRRGQRRSPSDQRKLRRHRFSINGHFYNHKTAVFTPAFGSVTNVRINSCMRTPQVLRVLLNKFKIENSPDDFALYLVHTSGERVKLKRSDYPLVLRIMQGPCEQVCKVFLMEEDLGEEVTYDVAQYIKFEMPVLQSFITKLKEEEDREVQKLRRRYNYLRCIIEKQLRCLPEGATCM
ncbi:ras association domain-containing protein 2b [Lates japonicus]|uniref:Ras association domain-containing protein 2b n=1 Tax=Lates japonicus TaxID=270547 RepID=A0AAD3MGQ3_LATJO|nr:ras association domain-containing protein 2b [Lates japonicus]